MRPAAITTVHGNASLANTTTAETRHSPIPTPPRTAEGAAPIADVAVVVDTPRFRELFLDVLATIHRAQNAAR